MKDFNIEEKRIIVIEHYSTAYKVKLDPNLKPEIILDLYEKLQQLRRSERILMDRKSAHAILKLIV